MWSDEQIQEALSKATETERVKILALVEELNKRAKKEKAKIDFISFVEHVWPEFIKGAHHMKMAAAFERVARGELNRLMICMPPRCSKSEFASYLLPAWFLGLYPKKQIMQLSHTADLAEQFGRKVRNLVDSDAYHEIFPETKLRKDSTAAARWNTDKNGIYQAMGVGAAVAGKGADLCLAKGSLVATAVGDKPIEEVQIGDYVLGGEGYAEVLHTIKSISDKEVTINNSFKCTPNHPIWVKNKGWVVAEKIKPGDVLTMIPLWVIIQQYLTNWRLKWQKVKLVIQQNVNITFGQ